jgi:hypothetical protein
MTEFEKETFLEIDPLEECLRSRKWSCFVVCSGSCFETLTKQNNALFAPLHRPEMAVLLCGAGNDDKNQHFSRYFNFIRPLLP